MPVQQMEEVLLTRKPEIAGIVPGDGMRFLPGQGEYSSKPDTIEIEQSFTCADPNSPTIILKEGCRRIIRYPILSAENRGISIQPPGEPLMGANPNTSVLSGKY